MKIKNFQDFLYIVRFGLKTVYFPALIQGVLAIATLSLLEARYLKEGKVLKKGFPLGKALLNLFKAKKGAPAPRPLGPVKSWEKQGKGVLLECQGGFLFLEFLKEDLLRIRLSPTKPEEELHSFAVEKRDWPGAEFAFEENEGRLTLKTSALICRVHLKEGKLSLLRGDGSAIFRELSLFIKEEGAHLSFPIEGGAQFYGLGEKASGLAHRGKFLLLWNWDQVTYDRDSDPLYSSIPFLLILNEGKFSGVFLDNASRSLFDLGKVDPRQGKIKVEKGEMRLYVFPGPSAEKVLELYSELTGKPPLPPLWSLGYHQSRWSYDSAEEVRRIASELRRRKIPCDAIHLDIDYMDGWRCFTWDKSRFPDPEKLSLELKREGFRLVPNVDPGIKRDRNYWVFRHGLEEVFLKLPDGRTYFGPVWPGYCAFPDFTDSRVRHFWGELNATLIDAGMSGVENDMDEPSVFGCGTVPDFLVHRNEGHPIFHGECHNAYGLLMAKASYEGWERLQPDKRPFVLTRSTFAGGQKYGATWTADNQSTWEHLWLSIPMCLNLALSGFSFVGVDVGGFARACSPELLVRWTQLGAFLPFFRNHCAKSMPPQEPWAFGQPYEDASRKAIELRYELLPYLYTAFWRCSQTGFPVIRPLIFDWPEIEEFREEDREFLFGDSLLVAPVLEEKARVREVIFPPGAWCDYFSGEVQHKGKVQKEVYLFSIPLFVKSGAIIPTWKVQQFIGEKLPEEVILRLYPGEGVSYLYEDDGLSTAYRKGKYLLTRLVQNLTGEGIEVEIERKGEENLGARAYTFRVLGLKGEPEKVEVDGKDFAQWIFEGGVLAFTAERPTRIKIALRKD